MNEATGGLVVVFVLGFWFVCFYGGVKLAQMLRNVHRRQKAERQARHYVAVKKAMKRYE